MLISSASQMDKPHISRIFMLKQDIWNIAWVITDSNPLCPRKMLGLFLISFPLGSQVYFPGILSTTGQWLGHCIAHWKSLFLLSKIKSKFKQLLCIFHISGIVKYHERASLGKHTAALPTASHVSPKHSEHEWLMYIWTLTYVFGRIRIILQSFSKKDDNVFSYFLPEGTWTQWRNGSLDIFCL